MTLRIGSIGGYVIAFSLAGLLLYALQLLPNIIWLAMPPANDVLKHNSSPLAAVNLVEQVFGIATVALLIIVITRAGTEGTNSSWLLLCAAVFLAGYYAAWVLYYQGNVSPWLLVVGIAAMPPLYYVFVASWMKDYLALVPCVIFGIAHIAITWSNYVR
jgi:hypothetical protein